jgi:hypothetical protein
MPERACGLVLILRQRHSATVSKTDQLPRCALVWKVACKHTDCPQAIGMNEDFAVKAQRASLKGQVDRNYAHVRQHLDHGGSLWIRRPRAS